MAKLTQTLGSLNSKRKNMKVAIAHDYLNQLGGAERVLEVFQEMFPGAPIFTLFYDPRATRGRFKNARIVTSFLDRIPIVGKTIGNLDHFFFWMLPKAVEKFDFSGFDLVISSSATYAKGIRVPSHIPHICYCYTPTRYLWEDVRKYVSGWLASPLMIAAGELFFRPVRRWDKQAALRPQKIIAISNHIAGRIQEIYGRVPDKIIFPPLDVATFKSDAKQEKGDYFLMAGRLLQYKKFEVGIAACNQLGLPLKIVGEGRERKKLESLAGPTIEFLGWKNEEQLKTLYARARAFIFPQIEDFGIVAAEATASGTPVIAYRAGGALDIVQEGINGLFFDQQSTGALVSALQKFQKMTFDPHEVAETAQKFDVSIFKQELLKVIESVL